MTDNSLIAAIVYDFDGTLSPGSMQEHAFIAQLGTTPSEFWQKVKEETKARDGDEILTYMQHMLQGPEITRASLQRLGAELPMFNGVLTWFDRINAYGQECGLEIEHYVISSGNQEMIEGCPIHEKFRHVFGSKFAYDEEGIAMWPAVSINFTNKTQYLFRINKDWTCRGFVPLQVLV